MSSARTRKRQMGCLQTDLPFIVRIGRMPVNEENEVFRVGAADRAINSKIRIGGIFYEISIRDYQNRQ